MNPEVPDKWSREGLVVARDERGGGCSVAGDPCIVWDEELPGWRMFLFYSPPGHAQCICRSREQIGPGCWETVSPLLFTNPEDLQGGATHKPFVIMDAFKPNTAARMNERYCW